MEEPDVIVDWRLTPRSRILSSLSARMQAGQHGQSDSRLDEVQADEERPQAVASVATFSARCIVDRRFSSAGVRVE